MYDQRFLGVAMADWRASRGTIVVGWSALSPGSSAQQGYATWERRVRHQRLEAWRPGRAASLTWSAAHQRVDGF